MASIRGLDRRMAVDVTATAAMANPDVGGHRLIPVIMIDTSARPDLDELIRLHEHMPDGDCHSQWATSIGGSDELILLLEFDRPLALSVALSFDLSIHSGAVDNILRARSMYLQRGLIGDTLTSTFHHPRILLELPPTGFESTWERLFRSTLTKGLRAEGMTRHDARRAVRGFIVDWRKTMGG